MQTDGQGRMYAPRPSPAQARGLVSTCARICTDAFGDLSKELDSRVKASVASYCGKEEYVPGDLTREVSSRISNRVAEFTGESTYEFGDISKVSSPPAWCAGVPPGHAPPALGAPGRLGQPAWPRSPRQLPLRVSASSAAPQGLR